MGEVLVVECRWVSLLSLLPEPFPAPLYTVIRHETLTVYFYASSGIQQLLTRPWLVLRPHIVDLLTCWLIPARPWYSLFLSLFFFGEIIGNWSTRLPSFLLFRNVGQAQPKVNNTSQSSSSPPGMEYPGIQKGSISRLGQRYNDKYVIVYNYKDVGK
jgi:hypothetical protein